MPGPLAVVIVNFRTPELTIRCVRSLLRHRVAAADDIIVVENASGDGSAAAIRAAGLGCRIVEPSANGGYGAGLNAGVAQVARDLVLCLNPDTYFTDDAAARIAAVFDADPGLGLLGLDLRYPSGERQYPARRDYSLLDVVARRTPFGRTRPGRRLVERHLMTDAWSRGPFAADWVMGTGFVVRRAAFDSVGGMDTDFFLYMEDVDLCRRLRLAGWRVLAAPGITLVHDHQRASKQEGVLSPAARRHLAALRLFVRKHGMPLLPRRT